MYGSTGRGVNVYLIDSGINYGHQDFDNRARLGADFVHDGFQGFDCLGHGTHVAAIIGGRIHGIAKEANLYSVRVYDCDGFGTTVSDIIAAIEWVTFHHIKPAVANMSFGTPTGSAAMDTAVKHLIQAGVTSVVAAGNSNQSAYTFSPARVPEAITVAASDFFDRRAPFSNYGFAVDLFAPGDDITSAWCTSATATLTLSGTSQAAPHVTGGAAIYLQNNPSASPAEVHDYILKTSTKGQISDAGFLSPNRLLYVPFSRF